MAPALIAVCSDKPRPVMQREGQKLKDPWKRDVYHIVHSGITTLCGRDRSAWLVIGPIEQITPDCCDRCARIVMRRKL